MTIISTNDSDLLTNSPYSPPPITGTRIPLAEFYLYVPIFLVGLYVYLNFYLIRLWRGLASLPAIFPDGKRLDDRAYPWLLNGLVCRHFRLLKRKTIINHSEESIIIFLAWWVVPFTMIAFWLRYLPCHNWFGTCVHIGLIVLSVAFSIIFYRLCALTLQGKDKTVFRLKNIWRDRRFYYGVSVVVGGILFSLFSYGAINGERPDYSNLKNINTFVPWVFNKIGYDVFADFNDKDVSEKPDNYLVMDKEENRLESVKGAKLEEADLRNADMIKAFLVKANLRKALLNGAVLVEAKLQQANLRSADLQKANLANANLQQADLKDANLQQAYLWRSNLEQAYLDEADLQKANLLGANLQHANLGGAKNLSIDQLSKVKTLYQARLDFELMEQKKKLLSSSFGFSEIENRQKK